VSDWSQVGGNKGRIVVLSRENSSGTYVFFRDYVLRKQNYRPDALLMPSTKAIQQEITNNPNAIGYGGVAYFKGKRNVKVVPVAMKPGQAPIEPTDDNIRSKKYPIARPLYVYTRGTPTGTASDFIKFALSPDGQRIVARVGYVSLK
jgi:phosphate transport system substrate-binding protein